MVRFLFGGMMKSIYRTITRRPSLRIKLSQGPPIVRFFVIPQIIEMRDTICDQIDQIESGGIAYTKSHGD